MGYVSMRVLVKVGKVRTGIVRCARQVILGKDENDTGEMNRGEHWSAQEVERIVAVYFEMLALELRGRVVEKARRNEALRATLVNRSKGSVDFKHANISAVMVALGLPFIDGYKPRSNYQGLLAEAVVGYLNAHPSFFVDAAESIALAPERLLRSTGAMRDIFVPGPLPLDVRRDASLLTQLRATAVDFAARDEANASLVRAGIALAVEVERHRLADVHGRLDLAEKVRAVSLDASVGFHVLSFEGEGSAERHIGVKTTVLGKHAPFHVSSREVAHSEKMGDRYFLYRLFEATRTPRVYARQGPLARAFRLEATRFVCAI